VSCPAIAILQTKHTRRARKQPAPPLACATGKNPSVTRLVINRIAQHPIAATAGHHEIDVLTPRELEVFTLVARGLSNREIAAALTVEESTIRTHVKRILMKLQIRDRVQAVILAYEAGLIRAGAAGSTPP
jgi:DNA-binding NarL/FixJ family response regulator